MKTSKTAENLYINLYKTLYVWTFMTDDEDIAIAMNSLSVLLFIPNTTANATI